MNIDNFIEINNNTSYSTVKLKGFIDASIIKKARPIADKNLPKECKNIIVDLTDVEFIDSHCIGFFVSLLKNAHSKKGNLIILGAKGQPESVLQMVGFNNKLVSYCDNYIEANILIEKTDS